MCILQNYVFYKLILKRILLLTTLIFTLFLFFHNAFCFLSKMNSWNLPENFNLAIKVQNKRYISCTFKACSGIGNQMFRFASLYAIGKNFNRSVFYSTKRECQKKYMLEIKSTFPLMYKRIGFFSAVPQNTILSDFGLNGWKYYDPNDLHDVPHKYLILNGNYMQSYKYFHQRKAEIRSIFEFDHKIKDAIHMKGKKLFGLTLSKHFTHNLCVHIRRGDFINHIQMESRAEFIDPAIDFLYRNLSDRNISKISLFFFGNDAPFLETLNFNRTLFKYIHHINMDSRAEDMYFGIRFCDTLLITASGSTFAWWIGYLLPEGKQVFYNAQVSKRRNFEKDWYDFDYFPKDWIMLEFDDFTQTVKIDNRWFYEKFGWPKHVHEFVNRNLSL